MSFFYKIFGNENEKYLKKINPLVEKINSLESKFIKFTDKELKDETVKLKKVVSDGKSLDDVLPEAFSLIREASKRTLNQRHFDVQLIGAVVLHNGKIAEMKTGEGKTLMATLSLFLNALSGKGCHLITVNDYLARRDAVWMGQIFNLLGVSTGCINHDQAFLYDPLFKNAEEEKDKSRDELGGFKIVEDFLRPVSRKEAYLADITYGTNNEFGFDYLRDNMADRLENQVQRGFNFAIIDEVDSVLIDEARTPLIISAPDTESTKKYEEFARVAPLLKKNIHFDIDEKIKAVSLTEAGIEKVEEILGKKGLYEGAEIRLIHHLEQALKAQFLFKKDRDYVVKNGKIIIVDNFTGRLLPGRRYSGGLHQAIEARERVSINQESKTLASITFQNYFRMYEKLAGMTGTAVTSAEEFTTVYNLEVIIIPTNLKMARMDLDDKIYKNEKAKFRAITEHIEKEHKNGRPVLVGTTSIDKSEYLGKLLQVKGILHQILNAKHHEREAEIVAQAGRKGAVTIATNMAGRGVDIVLGGNPSDENEAKKIKDIGGLYVVGTERHEARRIDNQLRGRAGRQGDNGSSQFFISLEDDILRIFGGDKIKKIMEMLKMPEDQPIEAKLVSGVIESAQSRIEGMNFDLRKHLLDYDDVLNKHREVIYKKRKEILIMSQSSTSKSLREYILEIVKKNGHSENDYEKKEKEIGEENIRKVEKIVSLRTLDFLWMDHLENMEYMRDSVRLRAYGQQDPLVEYKNEGHKMFHRLLQTIESGIVDTIFKVGLAENRAPVSTSVSAFSQPSISTNKMSVQGHSNSSDFNKEKIGRNDPCSCGSGKKFKKCCGR